MPVFLNGIPFVAVESNGVEVAPFAQKLNIIGAQSVTRQAGVNADTVDIDVSTGGGGISILSAAQMSLTTLRNGNETGTLTYDTEDFDTDNWIDLAVSTSNFVVPAGVTHARIGGSTVFATNVSGDFLLASQINNAPAGIGRAQIVVDHASSFSGIMRIPWQSGFMPVSPGDTLRVQTNGPDTTVAFQADGVNYTWVQGYNIP